MSTFTLPAGHRIGIRLLLAALLGLAGLTGHATSLLLNPGFELGTSFGGWQTYGANTYDLTSATQAHSGTNYLKVYQAFTGAVNYDGIYQDFIAGPGAAYNADGWFFTATNDAVAGQNAAWLEVTFRDANANVLALYRSALINTNALATHTFPKSAWTDLRVTNQYDPTTFQVTNTVSKLIAPPGAIFLRYQIVFYGDANYSGGAVFVDDLNLTQVSGTPYGNMNIVWSDEFSSNAINSSVWTYETGAGGWGNNELEYYTSRTNNAYTSGGYLHIAAKKESYGGSSYTSARMKTQGLFSFKYGRLEWRAQLPQGVGFWPALWLLGTNIATISWPNCGEIDVVENNGSNPLVEQGSLHSGSDETGYYNFIDGTSVTNFHTYTLDWTTNAFLYYVDGHLYETQTGWGTSTTNSYPFPFNQPFFILMNVAVGGSYLGNPGTNTINAGTTFPGEMVVDYVRLYVPTDPLQITLKKIGANYQLQWPGNILCHLQAQTYSVPTGLGTNWTPIVTTTNQVTLIPGKGSAFYRLTSP